MFVVASRPNFMKIAPLIKEAKKRKINFSILYTEQHKSESMTGIFSRELNIPKPDYSLGLKAKVGKLSKNRKLMAFFSSIPHLISILRKDKPDYVIVVGDVISSAYVALIAKKIGLNVAHVESGLRSFNNEMPEEKARIIIDNNSELLFTTEESANEHLKKEGVNEKKIFFVGNIMIDSLSLKLKEAEKLDYYKKFKLKKKDYAILTFHRHENLNGAYKINKFILFIKEISKKVEIVYPLHPAAKIQFKKFDKIEELNKIKNIKIIEPVGYLAMLNLMLNSKFVMTDSGGIQEETTFLKIPCLTLRTETERPVTVKIGTNTVVGLNKIYCLNKIREIEVGLYKKSSIPRFWDGKTAERILEIIKNEKR